MSASEIDSLKQDILRTHLADLKQGGRDSAVDFVQRGYLDGNGEATELGEEYLSLLDSGLLDKTGNLTDEGRVYATSYRDSLDESPEIYKLREERGLNTLDKGAGGDSGGIMSMLGDFVTKGVPRMAETAYNAAVIPVYENTVLLPHRAIARAMTGEWPHLPKTQTHDETVNAIAENITGGILASEPLAAGVVFGGPQLAATIQGKKDEAYAAKQQWELHNAEVSELKGAEMMDWLTGADQWLQSRAALVAKDGEQAVSQNESIDRTAGSFVFDPQNILSMGAGKAAQAVTAGWARASLNAEKLVLKAKTIKAAAAAAAEARATIEAGMVKAAATAREAAEKAVAMRAVGNESKAVRYEAVANRLTDRAQPFATRVAELAETEAKAAADLARISGKEGFAEALVKTNARIAAVKQFAPDALGRLSENIGRGLVATDEYLANSPIAKSYDALRSVNTRLASAATSAVVGPLGAIPGIASQIMNSGPLLQSIGNFSKILGKELIAERGSVPFWRRVANNATATPVQRFLSHRADELATLGGMGGATRGVIKGTAAAYPMNLALDVMQDPDHDLGRSAKNAFGPSLVFGGGMAGAGALFKGSKQRMKETRIADEINFTRNLDPDQQAGFSQLSRGGRRGISTYAAAFPNANYTFREGVPSHYDIPTNTIQINPKDNNPVRTLISHEVQHYVTIRNQMQPVVRNMMLGDSETPGLLRSTDGKLDPDFQKLSDTYNKRMRDKGLPEAPIERIAEEYFNESVVDSMVGMVESGELSKMAGRTQLGRKVRALIDATIPQKSIARDFFFRTGGAIDPAGRHVMGNGLLADGIREFPEARALMRKMLRESAGTPVSAAKKAANPSDGAGASIPVAKGDPIVDSFHSILETDANGVPIRDKDGDHVALSRAKDEARKQAGLAIIEAQAERVNKGHLPDADEIQLREDGTWSGTYVPKPLIDALAAKGIYNNKQIAIMRELSRATKPQKGPDGIVRQQGHRYLITNFPATIRGRGGKLRYNTTGATLRETVPTGFQIHKDGQITVPLLNVEQLDRNITNRAASARGRKLYNGDTEAVKKDVQAVMELHSQNKPTDAYFEKGDELTGFDGYGPQWKEYKNFINTMFGLMTKAQQDVNPMFQSDKVTGKEGVFRTYRLDRISKAIPMDGTLMPFGYTHIKANYLPD